MKLVFRGAGPRNGLDVIFQLVLCICFMVFFFFFFFLINKKFIRNFIERLKALKMYQNMKVLARVACSIIGYFMRLFFFFIVKTFESKSATVESIIKNRESREDIQKGFALLKIIIC